MEEITGIQAAAPAAQAQQNGGSLTGQTPAEQKAQAKKAYSRIGFALLALAGVTTIIQILLGAVMMVVPALQQTSWYLWVMTFAPIYLVAFPITVLILRKMPAQAPAQHTFGFAGLAGAFSVCMAAMWAGNLIGTGLSMLLSGGQAQNPLGAYTSQTSIFSVLVMVILAPIVEETIFRKLLIDRIARFGGALAVLMSGLCFGMFHMNLYQFFYAFAIGAVLAYVYLRTGKVVYTIGLHMIINLCGSVIAVNAAAAGGVALGIYVVALLALVICGVVVLIVKTKRGQITFAPEKQLEHGFCTAMANPGMILYTVFCVAAVVLVLAAAVLAAAIA
ncbi:MAG: CPBP family intramembrane metalloprotease [Faecalibacterium sp.]|jgi:membrane protease YdiL (CAAX protease family)|nr:CPBP family intramembrane metalloprotease [Faecalibacterium sp.]